MALSISDSLLDRIRYHGTSAYPLECCGLLLGRAARDGKSVVDLMPMQNSREDTPESRYLIAPDDLLVAEKEARKQGVDIIGVYHSHPDHPARPSNFDREHAFPWYSYIIVSVEKGEAIELTSWILRDDRSAFDPEDLQTA